MLSTLELRGLNQQVIDGRLPEAVGGEFADANGLGGPARRRDGPADPDRLPVVRRERDARAPLRGGAARRRLPRARARDDRAAARRRCAAMRRGRIDMWPGYSGSLRGYLGGRSLKRALARIGARPLRLSPGPGPQRVRDEARRRRARSVSAGCPTSSATGRAAAHQSSARARAAADPRQSEQWAVAPGSVLDLPGAWQLASGAGVTVAIVDSGARLDHADLAPNIWTNFDEVPGNGVDDDHNGYVDDVHGVDLTPSSRRRRTSATATGTAPTSPGSSPPRGTAAASSASPRRARLMIVKVLDDNGAGTTGARRRGHPLRRRQRRPRHQPLASAGDERDPRLVEAVEAAGDANVLVVTSAGNDGARHRQQAVLPGGDARRQPARRRLHRSRQRPRHQRVLQLRPARGAGGRARAPRSSPPPATATTSSRAGTSMAAPMVAGVAALAASVEPAPSARSTCARCCMQNATRSRLPVAAGYVDALHSVLAASSAVGYDTTQPPSVKILDATRKGRRTRIQVGVARAPPRPSAATGCASASAPVDGSAPAAASSR